MLSMSRKITRILVCGSTQGVYGGIEIFMTALAGYLHGTEGFETELLFKLTSGSEVQPSLRELTGELPFPVNFVERGVRPLLQRFRHADVIHTQNVPPDVVVAAKLLRKPVVATVHNWRRPTRSLHTLLWRVAHAAVDARTYNSAFVRRSWTRAAENSRSRVIPTVSRLPREPAPWEGRRGFLFVGRWITNKGLDDLVRAYAEARLDTDSHPLVLLGEGPLRPEVECLIASLNMKGVELCGRVSDEEKFRRLGAARWLVAPPRTQEDLGLTPIEARSLRIPVIASRDGGLPEAAGDNALYFEPGDIPGLSRCLQQAASMSEEEYQRRARGGHETLSTFLQPMASYTEIYQQLTRS